MTETAGGVLSGRWIVRRTVYLLIGGAVAVAFVMLGSVLASPVQGSTITDLRAPTVAALVLMTGVGLLPGIREVQVAATQTLLGVPDVTVPVPMRWRHRWRTALWTLVHQLVGFAAALAIAVTAIAVSGVIAFLSGRDNAAVPSMIERPDSTAEWVLFGGGTAAALLAAVAIIVGGGAGARWSAPLLLGSSGDDRLAAAERRLRREQEYRRLSRDLHDGVGHALSAISLQATAGERVVHRDPYRAATALSSIQSLAADAVGELDDVLAVLRDDAAPAQPEPTLADLSALITRHQELGMTVHVDADLDDRVPAPLSRLAYRICAEALSNAAKHGDPGLVTLQVGASRDDIVVRARNSSGSQQSAAAGQGSARDGHGLAGLAESVAVFGGTLSAAPDGADWVLDARLPRGGAGGRR